MIWESEDLPDICHNLPFGQGKEPETWINQGIPGSLFCDSGIFLFNSSSTVQQQDKEERDRQEYLKKRCHLAADLVVKRENGANPLRSGRCNRGQTLPKATDGSHREGAVEGDPEARRPAVLLISSDGRCFRC